MDNKLKNKRLFMAIGLFLISGLLLFMLFNKKNNIDTPPSEGSSADFTSQAVIVDGEALLNNLGGIAQYDNLSRDLFTFAKSQYTPYSKIGSTIGFKVSKNLKKNNNTISAEGKFGSSKNNIKLEVTILKNGRIKTSITDTKTNTSIDNELPSNTAKNQFIGSLPVDKNTFMVDYTESEDNFLVTSYDGTEATKTAIQKFLVDSLKVTDITKIKYSIYTARSSGTVDSPDFN